jgi:hypothetical protein
MLRVKPPETPTGVEKVGVSALPSGVTAAVAVLLSLLPIAFAATTVKV